MRMKIFQRGALALHKKNNNTIKSKNNIKRKKKKQTLSSTRGGSQKILRVRKFVISYSISSSLDINILIPGWFGSPPKKVEKVISNWSGELQMYFLVEIYALNYFDFLFQNWGFTAVNFANSCICPCTYNLKKLRYKKKL